MAENLPKLFERVGLSEKKAAETTANKKLSSVFESVIKEAEKVSSVDKTTGSLLYYLSSNVKSPAMTQISYLSRAIATKRLQTTDQVSAAIKFVDGLKDSAIDDKAFDESCGVGIVVTNEDIAKKVSELLASKKEELELKRHAMVGPLLMTLRKELRWANGLSIKEEFDRQLFAAIGPKHEVSKNKLSTVEPVSNTTLIKEESFMGTIEERAKSTKLFFEGELAKLHRPGENKQINDQLMVEHLKRTGGKMVTRFPPEPNGFLHIGHAKAININFGFADANNGITYLRYDDTNPEAEEDIYFKSILDSVQWLGYKPVAIKYSSDYFQRLYELAIELIKKDKAYVCHHSAEEMRMMRGGDDNKGPRSDSKWRNRPIEESLAEFQKMKDGFYPEGNTTLRMKMDMQHPNPQFWDLVAYRVLYTPHVRTGKDWCIYPTYDYTHCLCDSFEDITHSLCTNEFVLSRESYYWLVDALEIYKPVQWEYGRLKLTNTVLSKRKLMKLVDEKIVSGWDDPRLFTLEALRRRGFTAPSINAFVRELGVTTTNSTIPLDRLERYVRDHLNETALRLMVILEPLKITLTNLPEDFEEEITVPNHPQDASRGSRIVPFSRTVYIDASDFREVDDPNFYRLAPGKTVGLLNVTYPITANKVIKDNSGRITEILATYENTSVAKKCKAYIQWVGVSESKKSPVNLQARLYSNLFLHPDPDNKDQVPGGWMSDINPDSLKIMNGAMSDIGLLNAKVEEKYQFVRIGYFCVDKETNVAENKFILNRTVGLKEDSKKDK